MGATTGADVQAAGVDDPALPEHDEHALRQKIRARPASNVSWSSACGIRIRARPRPPARPVRLCVQGSLSMKNNYGILSCQHGDQRENVRRRATGYCRVHGPVEHGGGFTGVNGFTDPHVMTPQDAQSALTGGGVAGGTWASLPSVQGVAYAGYRLPDYVLRYKDVRTRTIRRGASWPIGTACIRTTTPMPWTRSTPGWNTGRRAAPGFLTRTLPGSTTRRIGGPRLRAFYASYMGASTKNDRGRHDEQPGGPRPDG